MDNAERVRRIAVLSRRLRWAIWLTIALLTLIVFAVAVGIGFGMAAKVQMFDSEVPLDQLEPVHRLLLLVLFSPAIVLGGWLLLCVERLLALYERGVIFSRRNAALIRRSGQLILGFAIVDSFVLPFGALVLVRASTDGGVTIEPNLGLFFVGVGIIVVGHVMSLGAEMAEEASLTV